jgi:hypothetical protein
MSHRSWDGAADAAPPADLYGSAFSAGAQRISHGPLW